ncbi:MAG: helix-turn-helix domain-containing protein [Verrucomicrobia bacterium]|nr:helix-turn-helix domain-containing protein [Verrucomicrobiota bacterium]
MVSSNVGELLRKARESRRLTVSQVADATKIKSDHITALEAGDFNPFSAPVYIRGHVKSLVRHYHLDRSNVLAALDAELARTEKFAEPPSLIPREKGVLDWIMLQFSKLNLRLLLPLILLALCIGLVVWAYGAWRRQQSIDPLLNLGPGYYKLPPEKSVVEYLSFPPGAVPTNAPAKTPNAP